MAQYDALHSHMDLLGWSRTDVVHLACFNKELLANVIVSNWVLYSCKQCSAFVKKMYYFKTTVLLKMVHFKKPSSFYSWEIPWGWGWLTFILVQCVPGNFLLRWSSEEWLFQDCNMGYVNNVAWLDSPLCVMRASLLGVLALWRMLMWFIYSACGFGGFCSQH